jgi:hypothetical protein
VHRIGRGRRVVPSAVAAAVAVAVCLCGPQAGSARPGFARAAAACPPMTMRLFDSSGKRVPTRVRIKRHHVTCANARRLITTYLRRVTPRGCASHGTRCILTLGGGWTCSFLSVTEGETAGGAIMGCFRSASTRFTIVPVAKVTQRDFYVSTAPGVSCEMSAATVFCENESPNHNDIATLAADGTLHACRSTSAGDAGGCHTGNPGLGTPTYNAGRSVTFEPFRCAVVPAGVRCVATASSKGFEMTGADVTAIGGATLLPTSP